MPHPLTTRRRRRKETPVKGRAVAPPTAAQPNDLSPCVCITSGQTKRNDFTIVPFCATLYQRLTTMPLQIVPFSGGRPVSPLPFTRAEKTRQNETNFRIAKPGSLQQS